MPVIDTGSWAGAMTGIMTESRLRSRTADDVRRLAARNLVGARSLARTSRRAIAGSRAASPTDRATAADAAGAPVGAATAVLNVLHRILISERVKQPGVPRERRRRSGREGHPNKHSQPQHKLSHDVRSSCDVAQPMAPPRNGVCVGIMRPAISRCRNWQISKRACRDAHDAGLTRVLLNGHSYRARRDRTQHLMRLFLQPRAWL
jgi:hypothetical protein